MYHYNSDNKYVVFVYDKQTDKQTSMCEFDSPSEAIKYAESLEALSEQLYTKVTKKQLLTESNNGE